MRPLSALLLSTALFSSSFAQTEWTRRSPLPTSWDLHGVVWTGDQYVSVGDNAALLTSPDAVAWTQRWHGGNTHFRSVVKTDSLIVAVGVNGYAYTSKDGVSWATHGGTGISDPQGLVWTGTQLVEVGGGGKISTSPDGKTWTPRTSGTLE